VPQPCVRQLGFSHLPTSFKHSLSPYHHTLRTSGFYIGTVAPGGGGSLTPSPIHNTQSDSFMEVEMELIALSLSGVVAILFLDLSEFVRHRRTSR